MVWWEADKGKINYKCDNAYSAPKWSECQIIIIHNYETDYHSSQRMMNQNIGQSPNTIFTLPTTALVEPLFVNPIKNTQELKLW